MAIDLDCESGRLEDFETGQSPYHTFGLLAADTPSLTCAELKKQLRQSSSPFPPLLFAYGLNTLIAQTYVSSHPLSGLVLVHPPLSIADASKSRKDLLKGQHQEFDYEPFFPIAILGNRKRAEELEQHRLRRDFSEEVHLLVTPDEKVIADDGFE